MIKKALMTAALAGCMTAGAHANILVNIGTTEGFFTGPTDLGGFLSSGESALIQLWFAGDGVIDGGGAGSQAGSGAATGVSGGNDTWLLDFVFSFDSTPSSFPAYGFLDSTIAFDDGGANVINGGTSMVYARVYESVDATADVGENYFVTQGLVVQDLDPAGVPSPTPDVLNLNSGGSNSGAFNEDSITDSAGQSFQVVPEPGTIALFGLGILTLLGRRRRS